MPHGSLNSKYLRSDISRSARPSTRCMKKRFSTTLVQTSLQNIRKAESPHFHQSSNPIVKVLIGRWRTRASHIPIQRSWLPRCPHPMTALRAQLPYLRAYLFRVSYAHHPVPMLQSSPPPRLIRSVGYFQTTSVTAFHSILHSTAIVIQPLVLTSLPRSSSQASTTSSPRLFRIRFTS